MPLDDRPDSQIHNQSVAFASVELLLLGSLVHHLIEKGGLTKNDALSIGLGGCVIGRKCEVRHGFGGGADECARRNVGQIVSRYRYLHTGNHAGRRQGCRAVLRIFPNEGAGDGDNARAMTRREAALLLGPTVAGPDFLLLLGPRAAGPRSIHAMLNEAFYAGRELMSYEHPGGGARKFAVAVSQGDDEKRGGYQS